MANIAVVDDKEILRDSLSAALSREDHCVVTFADPVEALTLVVLDVATGTYSFIEKGNVAAGSEITVIPSPVASASSMSWIHTTPLFVPPAPST